MDVPPEIAFRNVDATDDLKRRILEGIDDLEVHDLPPHGRVVRLLTDDTGVRFGFLMSRDGREIYFHENALVDLDFEDLDVGTEVRFAEGRGDEGPQASTVAPLDPDRIGPTQEAEVPLREA